jgi:hypothetical protein
VHAVGASKRASRQDEHKEDAACALPRRCAPERAAGAVPLHVVACARVAARHARSSGARQHARAKLSAHPLAMRCHARAQASTQTRSSAAHRSTRRAPCSPRCEARAAGGARGAQASQQTRNDASSLRAGERAAAAASERARTSRESRCCQVPC